MATFVELWSEVAGRLPNISPLLCQKFVNSALHNIYDSREWSFHYQPFIFNSPDTVAAGTVTLTQGSAVVTCDATAAAALDAIGSSISQRQFRVGGSGPVYFIQSFTSPNGPLTLTQPYWGESEATGSYAVYQAYYPTPTIDFVRWESIYNPDQGYWFNDLQLDQRVLNAMDPQRSNQGQPYKASGFATGQDGRFLYEFWPTPTQQFTFSTLYRRRGVDLVLPTDPIPNVLTRDCVVERALYYGYQWGMANQARFPDLKGVNFGLLIREHKDLKNGWNRQHLLPCKKADDDIRSNSIVLSRRSRFTGPIDGAFLQGHTGFFNWPS